MLFFIIFFLIKTIIIIAYGNKIYRPGEQLKKYINSIRYVQISVVVIGGDDGEWFGS